MCSSVVLIVSSFRASPPSVALRTAPLQQRGGPLDIRGRCSSTSLRLLPRVVVWPDIGESPGTHGANLHNRLFVDENVVCRAWRQGVETARGERLRLALISVLSHPQAEGPGDHR